MHSIDARALGESEQRLYTLEAWRETPFFSDRERAALAWTELLVDFFFYPTFMRHFKSRPRLRLFAATFVAVGLGNSLLHFLTGYLDYAQQFGLWNMLLNFQSYFLYSIPLALGIGISQLRNAPQRSGWIRGKLIPAFCVVGFFCVLYVFDNDVGFYSPADHFRFVGHLLNLR